MIDRVRRRVRGRCEVVRGMRADLLFVALAAVLVAGSNPGAQAQEPKAEDAAEVSATTWLAMVDSGHYGESWREAAVLFKGATTQDEWERRVAGVRAPLGKVVSRKVRSRQYAEKLPGAPDGRYVIIEYGTSFENKREAIETVTPMLETGRGWRVSGYYIR